MNKRLLHSLLMLCLLAGSMTVSAATFTVTNGNNQGAGSLRAAILAANADSSASIAFPHVINLQISGSTIIEVTSPLPTITQPLIIDGTRGVSASTMTPIRYEFGSNHDAGLITANAYVSLQNLSLSNSSVSTGRVSIGFRLQSGAASSQLRGVRTMNFRNGILIDGANNVLLTEQLTNPGNWRNRITMGAITNEGILVSNASNVTIRGATVGDCVFCANSERMQGPGIVLRNVNGATVGAGDRADANSRVLLHDNGSHGLWIDNSQSVVVTGNWIGVSPTQQSNINFGNGWNAAFAGDGSGIRLTGSTNVLIGGDTLAEGNVIGHNRGDGVFIFQSDAVVLLQNRIGVTPNDSVAGNTFSGISVSGSRAPNGEIQIGGILDAGNRIQNNGQGLGGGTSPGIFIADSARNVGVYNNSIYSNHGGVIDGAGATNKFKPQVYLADSTNNRIRVWSPTPFPDGTLTIWTDTGSGTEARFWRDATITFGGGNDYTLSLAAGALSGQAGRNLSLSFKRTSGSATQIGASDLTTAVTVGPPRVIRLQPTSVSGGQGSVTITPSGFSCSTGSTCSRSFSEGVQITLTATPAAGSQFSTWLYPGCPVGGNPVCTLTVPNASLTEITPAFTGSNHTLTVNKTGSGVGTVTSNPAGINCGASCQASFASGTPVTLSANVGANSIFTGWSGSGCSGTGTCTVTMSQARTVTANFALVSRQLTVSKTGAGTGLVTSSPEGINCGATCQAGFDHGTVVTLSANATGGASFVGWSGSGCSGTGSCVVTMTQARSVTATFTQPNRTLTLSKTGTGVGGVVSSPAGIDCGSTCQADFPMGSQVVLTATPGVDSVFIGWAGGGCFGTGTCTVTMSNPLTVVAMFDLEQRTLTVNKTGSGQGTVTSSPAGINCGATCQGSFDHGTQVTLTASPQSGSTFNGWSGSGCSGTGTCVVTMSQARTVTATFNQAPPNQFNLQVNRSGQGTVSSVPAGINCGSQCQAGFDDGETVILTAAPASGHQFAGWGGACAGTQTSCTVVMSEDRTVSASFVPIQYNLTVNKTGSGQGTVTSNPSGIDCGASCQASFDQGTQVTLAASASAGSSFTGWSGSGCSGTGTCTVSMTQARSVTAAFQSTGQQVQLTVHRKGNGEGTVTSSPAGIQCGSGSGCQAQFPLNSQVTLSATPQAGFSFAGWTGPCQGTGSCVVTMDQAKTVGAFFNSSDTIFQSGFKQP